MPDFNSQFRDRRITVFTGIFDQIEKYLAQTVQISSQSDPLFHGHAMNQHYVRIAANLRHGHRMVQQIAERARFDVQNDLTVLKHAEVKQIIQQTRQTNGLILNN